MGFRLTLIVFFLIFFYNKISLAQEPQVIRVKKELNLKKVVFDNSEFRLMVIDRFGNPRENKIASYQLDIKMPNETKIFFGFKIINYILYRCFLSNFKQFSSFTFYGFLFEFHNQLIIVSGH